MKTEKEIADMISKAMEHFLGEKVGPATADCVKKALERQLFDMYQSGNIDNVPLVDVSSDDSDPDKLTVQFRNPTTLDE